MQKKKSYTRHPSLTGPEDQVLITATQIPRVELNKNNRRNRAGEQQRNNVNCCLVTNIYIYQINPKFIIYNRIQRIRFLLYK